MAEKTLAKSEPNRQSASYIEYHKSLLIEMFFDREMSLSYLCTKN